MSKKSLITVVVVFSILQISAVEENVHCYFAMCNFNLATNGTALECDPITLIDSSFMYLYGDNSFAMCHNRSGIVNCELVAEIETDYMGSYGNNICPLGFKPDPENAEKCIPICEFECPGFSFCTAYNLCMCNDGYHVDVSSNGDTKCQAICEENMENAQCIAPNVWKCNEGYTKSMQLVNGALMEYCEGLAVFACKIVSVPVLVALVLIVLVYIVKIFEKKKLHELRETEGKSN